jgi:hypothetical protein
MALTLVLKMLFSAFYLKADRSPLDGLERCPSNDQLVLYSQHNTQQLINRQ